MDILGQIANPRMANIAQAIDVRQQRVKEQQDALARVEMGRAIAKALPNLQEGSSFRWLAENDPEKFALVSKVLNIPLNDGERFNQYANDVNQLYSLAQADPNQAYAHAQQLIESRKAQGQDTSALEKWVAGMNEDPMKAVTSLFVMHRSLNPPAEVDPYKAEALDIRREELALKREQMERGVDQSRQYANQYFQTADGLVAVNPATNQAQRVTVDGSPIISGQYDPNLKRGLSEAGATGTAVGKDTGTAITSVSQVEDNAKLLRNKVKAVLDHPGRDIATGTTSVLPVIPGTKQADFVNRFEQLQGDAFLQAFESLKGGGQITEIEGQKAQQAINRMNRGTSKEEFDAAAKDFLSVVDALEKRTKQKAGKTTEQQNKTGGVEMVDANGNRAIVMSKLGSSQKAVPSEDYLARRKRLLGK